MSRTLPRNVTASYCAIQTLPGWTSACCSVLAKNISIFPGACLERQCPTHIALLLKKVKHLSLREGSMDVRELQTMVENCTNPETFEIRSDIFVAHYRERNTDALSLGRHASTLKRLVLHKKNDDFDYRWFDLDVFALSSFAALTHVEFWRIHWKEGLLRCLASVTGLKSLEPNGVAVCDDDMEAVLPFLPQLRTVRFSLCDNLTFRVLPWLPQDLDLLSNEGSSILCVSPGTAGVSVCGGTKTLKKLEVKGLTRQLIEAKFEHFLEIFAGHSIESITVSCYGSIYPEHVRTDDYLMCLLEKIPNLKHLDLSGVCGMADEEFRTIARSIGLQAAASGNSGRRCFRATRI